MSTKEIKKGLFVAAPSYEGKIHVDTSDALIREAYAAFGKGIQYLVQFRQHNMMSAMIRNWMVGKFLDSEYSHIAFVDWDVSFPTGTLCNLMERDVDIVAAAYPYKNEPVDFPMAWLGDPGSDLWLVDPKTGKRSNTGLVEVAGAPTGCMVISRSCLETMISMRPDLEYYEPALKEQKAYSLFEWIRRDRLMYTEDFAFCNLARECGFKVWVDPSFDMAHVGYKKYTGNMLKWMTGGYAHENREAHLRKIMEFNEGVHNTSATSAQVTAKQFRSAA